MKVVHILVGKANPNKMNGVNKVVHCLATAQLLLKYEVQVWGITKTPGLIRHQHTYELNLFSIMKNRFMINKEILEALNDASKDTIFHLHSVFLPEFYAISRQLKKRNLRWVLTPHGGYSAESLKKNYWIKRVYKFLFENDIISGASAIHTLGEYGETEQFSEKVRKNKISIIPNGNELSNTYKKSYTKSGCLSLCFCGRLSKNHKGLDLLIKALALSLERGCDVTLNMIGDGPDRDFLQKMTNTNNLNHVVTFSGEKIGEEKYLMIQKSDIFVHTSRWEGLPTAVLEAASMALPLLVTLPTNMGKYIDAASAGYVVPELTSESVSRAIQLAASDKKIGVIEQKGIAARKMIKKSFSWLEIAKLIENKIYLKNR
jgi:glycosyltransferase involved in cell wall biosynthesis